MINAEVMLYCLCFSGNDSATLRLSREVLRATAVNKSVAHSLVAAGACRLYHIMNITIYRLLAVG